MNINIGEMCVCSSGQEKEQTRAVESGCALSSVGETQTVQVGAATEAPGTDCVESEQTHVLTEQEIRVRELSKEVIYDTRDSGKLLRKYPGIEDANLRKHMLKRRFKMHSPVTFHPIESTEKDTAGNKVPEASAVLVSPEKTQHLSDVQELSKKSAFLNTSADRFVESENARRETERAARERAEALEAEANERRLCEEAERKRLEGDTEEKRLRGEQQTVCEGSIARLDELQVLKHLQREDTKEAAIAMIKTTLEFAESSNELRAKKEELKNEIASLGAALEEKKQTGTARELESLRANLADLLQEVDMFSQSIALLDKEAGGDIHMRRHRDMYLIKGAGFVAHPEDVDGIKGYFWKRSEKTNHTPLFVFRPSKIKEPYSKHPVDLEIYNVRDEELCESLSRFEESGCPMKIHPRDRRPEQFKFLPPASEEETVQQQAIAFFNRLMHTNLYIIYQKIYELGTADPENVGLFAAPLIDVLFDKAVSEGAFVGVYTELCRMLCFEELLRADHGASCIAGKYVRKVSLEFRKTIIGKVQREYNKNKRWKESGDDKEEMRERFLGTLVFIANLFRTALLTKEVILGIIGELFRDIDNAEWGDIKCLTIFLTTVGEALEFSGQCETAALQVYYDKLDEILAHKAETEPRKTHVYYMILNVVEKRKLWTANYEGRVEEVQPVERKPSPKRKKRVSAMPGVKKDTAKTGQQKPYVPKKPGEAAQQASAPSPAPVAETAGPAEDGKSAVIEEGSRETSAELKEYYVSGDPENMAVTASGLFEKGFPKEKFVEISVYKGIETGKERCRAKTSLMVNVLLEEKLLDTADVVKGFLCAARSIPELKQDVPYAVRYFKEIAGGVSIHGEIMEALEQGEKELWSELSLCFY
ncbi:MAG: translation initiation factor eIF4G [Amphiamblys sp. WSBS2006]|nr:MAG: translation initiation factor eIF4G [Amphiamblys sp. WSBS2006]